MNLTQELLIFTSLTLGLRHGIDWDHIAAITDIVTAVFSGNAPKSSENPSLKFRALFLISCYAIGHSGMVMALGLLAICFRAILATWVDGIMERIVGVTLLSLSFWAFYSVTLLLKGERTIRLQSRWMLLGSSVRYLVRKDQDRAGKFMDELFSKLGKHDALCSFIIGILHGIGAETGTQVLLLASVVSTSRAAGLEMLASFTIGLLLSNLTIGLIEIRSFKSVRASRPLLVSVSIAAGIFGIAVGTTYISGLEKVLPDLHKFMGV